MFSYLNSLLAFKLNSQHHMVELVVVVVGTMAAKTKQATHNMAMQLEQTLKDLVMDSLISNSLAMHL